MTNTSAVKKKNSTTSRSNEERPEKRTFLSKKQTTKFFFPSGAEKQNDTNCFKDIGDAFDIIVIGFGLVVH